MKKYPNLQNSKENFKPHYKKTKKIQKRQKHLKFPLCSANHFPYLEKQLLLPVICDICSVFSAIIYLHFQKEVTER